MQLELTAIRKWFGGVRALDGASLSAGGAEIHALCGENGAGKSTLLKVLSGVYRHGSFEGELTLDGAAQRFTSPADARRAGIAMVHQELMLVPALSVAENLYLGREPGRAGLVDDLALLSGARALLARYGLASLDADKPVGELGIGLQQMVEIVRALAQDAKILILDEPTAALTSAECDRLHEWLRALRRAGTTCLYVSHRMDEIFALCDRITVLRDGRTAATFVTAETSAPQVIEHMVGRAVPQHRRDHAGGDPYRGAETPGERAAPALEVRGLCLHGVLTDLSFQVAPGEVVAIAGAMGSGRTALLSTLFGAAHRRVDGEVRVHGALVRLRRPADAIAAGLALVPEDRKGQGLVLGLSAADNLTLPAVRAPNRGLLERLGFVDDLADQAEAERRIAALRVRGTAPSETATLSGGNQQKIALGKWLGPVPPRVLLLDEPTRGVDVGAREEIYDLLDALRARGLAIVLASSDLAEVLRLADRILVLRDRKIAGELSGKTATENDIVTLSTGAVTPTQTPQPPPPIPGSTDAFHQMLGDSP